MIKQQALLFLCALCASQLSIADQYSAPIGAGLFNQNPKSSAPVSASSVHAMPVVGGMPALIPVSGVPAIKPVTEASVPIVVPASIPAVSPKHIKHHKPKTVLNDENDVFYDFSDHKKIVDKPEKKAHVLAVPLPGLGTVEGDRLLNKSPVIRINGDGTEIVEVSNQFQNRISTPFNSPKVIDSSHAEFKIVGSSVYVVLTGKPVVIYISGADRSDPVVSLTLVPKPIPAQTVILQLDQPLAQNKTDIKLKPETYEQHLSELLTTVSEGDSPEGFTKAKLNNIVARKGVMGILPTARFSNANMDIFSYKVTNMGAKTEQLSESSF